MKNLVWLLALCLTLVAVGGCGNKDENKSATPAAAPTPNPYAPPTNPGNPNSLAYKVGIEGSWVSDCVPMEGGYSDPYRSSRYRKRARYVFAENTVVFYLETFTDSECMDPNSRDRIVLQVRGFFQLDRELWEEGEAKQITLVYQACEVGPCQGNYDPYRNVMGAEVLIYKLRYNRLYFGANAQGGRGGAYWNLDTPFYREGSQPTAPR